LRVDIDVERAGCEIAIIHLALLGVKAMPYKLNVNGQTTTVDVPADMPLLWVVRDVLNLKGTKFGCGAGLCGACTVHLNGRAVRSCQTPVSVAAKGQIVTLEGLSTNGTHAVQLAWQELDVPQCGYCQAGQMMSASALLARTPSPTDQEIDDAMFGNICRCGTYLRIRPAIHRAAVIAQNMQSQPNQSAASLTGKI
jgi:isoquinoline 1-oxidoreductase alpha subunit